LLVLVAAIFWVIALPVLLRPGTANGVVAAAVLALILAFVVRRLKR